MRMVKNVLVAEKKRLLSSQLNILIEMVMSIEKLLAIFINGLFGIIFPKKDSQSYAWIAIGQNDMGENAHTN